MALTTQRRIELAEMLRILARKVEKGQVDTGSYDIDFNWDNKFDRGNLLGARHRIDIYIPSRRSLTKVEK